MKRKRFRLALVVALALAGGGLVAPSAVAALGGPATAATAATPFRADDGDDDADDRSPRVDGRDHENLHSSDNGSGCFYPPSRQPRVNLYDPDKSFRVPSTIELKGRVSVGGCGIVGLTLMLYTSRNGGENNWNEVPGAVAVTRSSGNFTFTGVPFTQTTFFRVTSVPRFGFDAVNSNKVKIKKK